MEQGIEAAEEKKRRSEGEKGARRSQRRRQAEGGENGGKSPSPSTYLSQLSSFGTTTFELVEMLSL